MPDNWKGWALGVLAAGAVTIAGNWSSSRIDVLESKVTAQDKVIANQGDALVDLADAVGAMRISLARIETKVDAVSARVERVERKIDGLDDKEPKRAKR